MSAAQGLVDTHCHLNDKAFSEGIEEPLERARTAGVARMVVVGCDRPSSERAVAQCEAHGEIFAAIGVHPHDAASFTEEDADWLRAMAAHPRVVAIGEIGLDYHYDFSPRPRQLEVLVRQLEIAREAALPVILHCREAYPDLLALLRERGHGGRLGGVMHCWAGTREEAVASLDLGLFLGAGGMVTFKNAAEIREAIALAPHDRVVVETDAPYLAPVPHRGKRNEPALVPHVAAKVAELWGSDPDAVAATTTVNAHALFPKLA